MRDTILIIDKDKEYSKKFCNQANKLYGKKYIFLYLSNVKAIKEYIDENKVNGIISTSSLVDSITEIFNGLIYILDESIREKRNEGTKTYIYKFQNVKNILSTIDLDLEQKDDKAKSIKLYKPKLIAFYATDYIKGKLDIVKRIAKYISKKKKILIVDLDEFENYKGNVGLSNIIFNYKENRLNAENIEKEIITEKNISLIKSVTYPEDFNVMTSVDLANIVSEIMKLNYDYVFVNLDQSYAKSQYIFNDSDITVTISDTTNDRYCKFKAYIGDEGIIDMKKVKEIDTALIDRVYLSEFAKSIFGDKNE